MGYLSESRRAKKAMADEAFQRKYAERWSDDALAPAAVRASNPNGGLIAAGWIVLVVGAFVWPILLVSFILGIILAAKGEVAHGVAIMLLTFAAPLLGLAVLFA